MSLTWEPSEEFLVAVQKPYKIGNFIHVRGLHGRIVEQITNQEYLEAWAWRGFNSEAISLNPRFYYRCRRIEDDSLGSTVQACSDPTGRGDQESTS